MPIGFWGYPNGNIPTSAMAPIEGGNWLKPEAAYWWNQMVAAFDADFPGYHLGVSEGYRDYATQVFYWELYQSGAGHPAARPGNSNHGWAMAVDIRGYGDVGTERHNWLRTHGPSFGWTWTTGQASGEPWHWEFTNIPTRPAGEGFEPIEEIDMTAEANIIKEIRTSEDRLRREDRPRLYSCTEHKDEFIIVNENLPSGDPGKIAYPRNAGQITSLELNYQFVADDVAQAQMRTHKQLETIIALARGYDPVFTPSGNFA